MVVGQGDGFGGSLPPPPLQPQLDPFGYPQQAYYAAPAPQQQQGAVAGGYFEAAAGGYDGYGDAGYPPPQPGAYGYMEPGAAAAAAGYGGYYNNGQYGDDGMAAAAAAAGPGLVYDPAAIWETLQIAGAVPGGPNGSPRREAAAGRGGSPQLAAFDKAVLEGPTAMALESLQRESAVSRAKWMDQEFFRQQREQVMQGARHRHWLVAADQWLLGVTTEDAAQQQAQQAAAAQEEAAGGMASRGASSPSTCDWPTTSCSCFAHPAVVVQRARTTVPVDDHQRTCALSGEPFETVFDEEAQEWHYKARTLTVCRTARSFGSCGCCGGVQDCARLTEEEAAYYGLPGGSLVLLSVVQGAGYWAGAAAAIKEEEAVKEDPHSRVAVKGEDS